MLIKNIPGPHPLHHIRIPKMFPRELSRKFINPTLPLIYPPPHPRVPLRALQPTLWLDILRSPGQPERLRRVETFTV